MKFPFFSRALPKAEEKSDEHTHQWDLIAKTFVEPKPLTITGDVKNELNRLAMTGMTTYLFQCSICSDFKKEECAGMEESSLDRLMDKVDIGGPEYILRDGKTYILLKQPPQDAQNLPLRR